MRFKRFGRSRFFKKRYRRMRYGRYRSKRWNKKKNINRSKAMMKAISKVAE